jgi:CRP-like cAMP-binding protein
MCTSALQKVYDANEVGFNALLLNKGELVFALGGRQSFSLKGENIIFGAAEVIYGFENNTMDTRMINVYTRGEAKITKIPNANLKKFITLYNIGFNITRVAARLLQKSNNLVATYNERFIQENNLSKRHYINYYNAISAIERECRQRGNPRLEAFIKLKKQTLPYRKGSLFTSKNKAPQEIESRRIDEFKTEFAAGSVICRQNDPASDLFVLNSGQIRVLLGNEEVASIDKPGSVLGEMSLFLNEPRSATLVAGTSALVTVIGRESLPAVSNRMPDFFFRITSSLWTRFKTNIEMLQEMEHLKPDSAKSDIKNLQKEIDGFMQSERIFWLKNYVDELQNAL